MKLLFLSEYIGVNNIEDYGVFNAVVNKDSHFFINVVRLRNTNIPEFSESYSRINAFFESIITLLDASKAKGDRFYKAAFDAFHFSELNSINLGFSSSKYGSGIGVKLRTQIMNDAFDIVKAGVKNPTIFQLIGLFEDNVGPDRISDMIATIIYPDLINYTKRILDELQTNTVLPRQDNGLLFNSYKNCDLVFVPSDLLHELPIAKCWEDISRVESENDYIRSEINEIIGDTWKKWSSSEKKNFIKNNIIKNQQKCGELIERYANVSLEKYDLNNNFDYFLDYLEYQIRNHDFNFISLITVENLNSKKAAGEMVSNFKRWVEYHKGWEVLTELSGKTREKRTQRIFALCADSYVVDKNFDVTFEADEGRGPLDFKVSCGKDKTVVEFKYSYNPQYLHGYQIQIEEYAIAENTNNKIYVLLDIGNENKCKELLNLHEHDISQGKNVADVVIIDCNEKLSASKY